MLRMLAGEAMLERSNSPWFPLWLRRPPAPGVRGFAVLAGIERPVPVCADESAHTSADLAALAGRYDAVNIKFDKTGGLTEALVMAKAAKAQGFKIMIGSMVATSLAAAPALLLTGFADWVDLDGPLLLARDRDPPLAIVDGWISPPAPELWG